MDFLADDRWEQLNDVIHEAYGLLEPDEVDLLAVTYDEAKTFMLEVMDVRYTDCVAEDHFEGDRYSPVTFPFAVHALLAPGDLFLATIGRRGDGWHVLHLNPPFISQECLIGDDEAEFDLDA